MRRVENFVERFANIATTFLIGAFSFTLGLVLLLGLYYFVKDFL